MGFVFTGFDFSSGENIIARQKQFKECHQSFQKSSTGFEKVGKKFNTQSLTDFQTLANTYSQTPSGLTLAVFQLAGMSQGQSHRDSRTHTHTSPGPLSEICSITCCLQTCEVSETGSFSLMNKGGREGGGVHVCTEL